MDTAPCAGFNLLPADIYCHNWLFHRSFCILAENTLNQFLHLLSRHKLRRKSERSLNAYNIVLDSNIRQTRTVHQKRATNYSPHIISALRL